MMSGDRLQIGHDRARSASYLNHWVKALRDDPREIYRAAQDTQEISDYVLGRACERDLDRDGEREPQRPRRDAGGKPRRLYSSSASGAGPRWAVPAVPEGPVGLRALAGALARSSSVSTGRIRNPIKACTRIGCERDGHCVQTRRSRSPDGPRRVVCSRR